MKRIGVLLAALLLFAVPLCFSAAESRFTGVVTYRSGKNVYLQNGTQGVLVFLDSGNDAALMAEVQTGKVVTVSGVSMTLKQAGYQIPEIIDAMIEAVADAGASASTVSAALDQLGDGLMATRVRVQGTKAQLSAAALQLPLDQYEDDQLLTVTGVLSANLQGRVILGAHIQPAASPTPTPTPEETAASDPTPTTTAGEQATLIE